MLFYGTWKCRLIVYRTSSRWDFLSADHGAPSRGASPHWYLADHVDDFDFLSAHFLAWLPTGYRPGYAPGF